MNEPITNPETRSIKRNLKFGSLGNGITVWDSLNEEAGDYQKVAHIDSYRNIRYYVDNLSAEQQGFIENYANTSDPAVSQTQQDKKVFVKTDLGNNESSVSGVFLNHDGTWTALTATQSKTFKTERGAENWFARKTAD